MVLKNLRQHLELPIKARARFKLVMSGGFAIALSVTCVGRGGGTLPSTWKVGQMRGAGSTVLAESQRSLVPNGNERLLST